MQVQKFAPPPKKKNGAKNMRNFGQFCTTSDFDREYLRNEATYVQNRKTLQTMVILAAFDEKVREQVVGRDNLKCI